MWSFYILFPLIAYVIPCIACFLDVKKNINRYRIDGDTLFFVFCPIFNCVFGYCIILQPLDRVFDWLANKIFK